MKKLLISMLIMINISAVITPCFAASEGNVFVGRDEAEEILEDIDIILEDVAPIGMDRAVIEGEMGNIVRDYTDIDIFKNNIKTVDEMLEYLKDANYLYLLPVYDNEGYELYISRLSNVRPDDKVGGEELEYEDLVYIESREGRWGVPGYGVCEGDQRLEEFDDGLKMEIFLRCYGIENSETFFVGGATQKSAVTGICFTDEGPPKGDGPYYVALDDIDLNAKNAEDVAGAVYTYDEMKEYAGRPSGGTSFIGVLLSDRSELIILIAAVVVAAVVIIIVKKLKKAG